MCGICGVLGPPGDGETAAARESRARAMMNEMAHRGPDHAALRAVRSGALAATRLAIRGLDGGQQPLVADAGVTVVCNGEIDNHRELRRWLAGRGRPVEDHSDVAVLPPLYLELGADFVEHLVGCFAIAVWDEPKGRLLLARDRTGEKPLYFRRDGDTLRFASEISALVAAGPLPTVDRRAIAHYLEFGSFPAPMSPLAGVEKVRPAEIVCFEGVDTTRRRFWRWRTPVTAPRRVEQDELDAALRQAVLRQSEVDARLGIFLSGGVDSSLIAALLRAVRPGESWPAYTLRFREPSFDEGGWAERVASRLGLEAIPVWMESADVPRTLPRLVRSVGEPLGDPAWVPEALLAARAVEDVRVALAGEGGDELFGGYPTYLGLGLAERFSHLPAPLRHGIARIVHALPPPEKKVTLTFLLQRFVDADGQPPLRRHATWISSLHDDDLRTLGVDPPAAPEFEDGWREPLDLVQAFDLETTLAEGLLTKADRAGMQCGLELRAPFLDLDVLELASHLPPEERVRGLTTKPYLKRFARRYLPRNVVYRRKRGLSVPMSGWLRRELSGWATERLGTRSLEAAGVDPAGALALLAAHQSGRADYGRALFALLALAEWCDWLGSLPVA